MCLMVGDGFVRLFMALDGPTPMATLVSIEGASRLMYLENDVC